MKEENINGEKYSAVAMRGGVYSMPISWQQPLLTGSADHPVAGGWPACVGAEENSDVPAIDINKINIVGWRMKSMYVAAPSMKRINKYSMASVLSAQYIK